MEAESPGNSEKSFNPIEVTYKELSPGSSLFRIDQQKLAEGLRNLGYPDNVRIPLQLSGESKTTVVGALNRLTNRITIYENAIARRLNHVYTDITNWMYREEDDTPVVERVHKDSWWQKFQDSKVYRTLWPGFWPYKLSGREEKPLFSGNKTRRDEYLWAAYEGTLMPGVPLEEQREHALQFYGRLLKHAAQREMAGTLAHEYEHKNKQIYKLGRTVALTVGSYGATMAAFIGYANIRGNLTLPEGIVGLGLPLVTGFIGQVRGVGLDERDSFDAEKNMIRLINSFQIDQDVFDQKVLGKQAE